MLRLVKIGKIVGSIVIAFIFLYALIRVYSFFITPSTKHREIPYSEKEIQSIEQIRKLPEKLCTKQADLNFGLPFIESNSQDYIICSLVLHYLKDWNCIINDFYRILTSKGKIYISIQHPFADYLNLQKESYSDSYFVEDVWGTGNKPFIVRFYTRNLEEILKPILNSNFKLESFLEPLPDKRCKDLAPDTFKKIKKIPPFLFLVLSK